MTLSILIPTVGVRAELLAQVTDAFLEQGADEVLTVEGMSWGSGLNDLAERAKGDYWLCACDDILPHAGWFDAARPMVDFGLTPATRYFTTDGAPIRPGTDDAPHGTVIDWCRSFLLTSEIFQEVGPFIDATWWADINYTDRLRASGREITACDGFSFTHLEGPRDWLTPEEEDRQRNLYEQASA